MPTLDRRVQILLAPEQYERLEREAKANHRSVASIIRESIELRLDRDAASRDRATDAFATYAEQQRSESPHDWREAKQALDDDLVHRFDEVP